MATGKTSTVRIRENGAYGADLIEVMYPDGSSMEFDWHEIDPNCLKDVLTKLGHTVVMIDYKFDHDED